MKKIVIFSFLMVLCFTLYSEEEKQVVKITGNMDFVLKTQNSYFTPLDIPAENSALRGGASNREDQNYRFTGNLNFSLGNPGVSQFFGLIQLSFDANDPDNIEIAGVDGSLTSRSNYTSEKVELGNVFVMWRPLNIMGGRPLGITLGEQTLKATVNPAYTHIFNGDPEKDFVLYGVSSIIDMPMINFDFHITKDTGVGFALGKGASDLVQAASKYSGDSSKTSVLYLEANKFNIGLNAAYQMVKGHSGATKEKKSGYFNEYFSNEYKYSTNAFNLCLSYEIMGIKPFIGYQKVWGEEAPIIAFEQAGFKAREIAGSVVTFGGKYDTKVKEFPIQIAGEFSQSSSEDFDGLNGFQKGLLDMVVESSPTPIANMKTGGAKNIKMSDKIFESVGGESKSIFSLIGFDKSYHFEVSVDVTENVKMSCFLGGIISRKDSTLDEVTAGDKEKIIAALRENGYPEKTTDLGNGVILPSAEAVAGQLIAGLNATVFNKEYEGNKTKMTEWTDTTSYGINIKYSF